MQKDNKIISFGCRLNSFESEVIRARLNQAGLEGITVLHTCAVTAEAERQALQAVRKAVASGERVIVAGCSAQNSRKKYAQIQGVIAVLDNTQKLAVESYKTLSFRGLTTESIPLSFPNHTKAFVQIQQGCNNRCSYCIVPLLRGNAASFSRENIIKQVQNATGQGFKEAILTGVDISEYGVDNGDNLADLCAEILAKTTIQRLRLSSLDPAKNYASLIDLMAKKPRIMPHIHLSMQSGDDEVLRAMRRRHTAESIRDIVRQAREKLPDIGIGADIIAGFPTETEEQAANTEDLVKELKIPFLHVFPYSERPGTKAAELPQIPVAARRARAKSLRIIGEEIKDKFTSQQLQKPHQILLEKNGAGYAENYIYIEGLEGEEGSVIQA